MTQTTFSPPIEMPDNSAVSWDIFSRSQALLLAVMSMVPVVLTIVSVLLILTVPDNSTTSDVVLTQILLLGAFITIVTFVFALLLGWMVQARARRRQVESVSNMLRFAYEVNEGNLATRIISNGDGDAPHIQLGQALNSMIGNLHEMARQVNLTTSSLNNTAQEILDATTQQIDAATQQDGVVSQTTATVNEVRATVSETAERAQSVAENAQSSIDISRSGEEAVADAIEGMHIIRRRVEDIADNILILSEHTQQIGEIITTVNSIADQSKMLALNASVEAARAGEEGKGFAVVALEVRNLAEQSRDATAQVRDILSEIQRATNSAVMVTEEGAKGVDGGVALVNRAGRAIQDLARTMEDNATAAVQIAASTRQQAVGMDQLTDAMQTIKQATAEATSSTMQVERSVNYLQEMADQLANTLSRYNI